MAEKDNNQEKIKALEEGKKTPKEVTRDVEVLPALESNEEVIQTLSTPQNPHATIDHEGTIVQPIPTQLVFESKSANIKKTIPYALIVACCMTIFVLVMKDTKKEPMQEAKNESEQGSEKSRSCESNG